MSTVEYIRSIRLKKAALLFQDGTFRGGSYVYGRFFQCFLLHPLLRGRIWQDTDGVLRDETRIGLYSYIHTWNIISCLACLAYMLRLPGLHCLSMSRATHSNVSAYALVRVGLHYRRH